MLFVQSRVRVCAVGAVSCLMAALLGSTAASAAPSLVVDVSSGEVLHQEDATRPWYPASLTKLMTVYVALKAVREGRMTLQTPMVVSRRASRMPPSKMALNPGTEVTLENALKMIMVKSANDISVTIAEGVSGSVPAFAEEMNAAARSLGMSQSHFVNPNGLHDEAHVSSARDMALLGRALFLQFPEQQELYGIGALKLGDHVIPTHNGLLGRYPGADGMKTGFVCASGFNVVASASRGGRRLIAVVMGSPNAKARTLKAMSMFEAGFAGVTTGSRQPINTLPGSPYASAPNMREQICGRNRNQGADEDFAIPIAGGAGQQQAGLAETAASFFAADKQQQQPAALAAFANGKLGPRPAFVPVPIYVGRAPGWTGVAAHAVDEDPAQLAAEAAERAKAAAAR
ncbi:MAG: D-alanyl-D-alanine carboxypeptidase, partial [Hyphomicrobiales bacterium]|nr:D-alanyl-D-alanine carboxypeptidase [Hyphomicrobiales bacterium]